MSIKLFKYMNGNKIRIPKSWILLVVFIVSVIGAGAWIYTTPPNGLTNQTGIWFGNNSLDGKNVTGDKVDVFGVFGIVIGSYVDSYSCDGLFCIYQPWYASGQYYSKNMSTGMIDYSGTDAYTVIQETINNSNGTVYISSGTYELSNVLIGKNNTIIVGEGHTTILRNNSVSERVLYFDNVTYITIKNIQIDQNYTNAIVEGAKSAVYLRGVMNFTIENVEINNSGKESLLIELSKYGYISNVATTTGRLETLRDGVDIISSSYINLNGLRIMSGDDGLVYRNSSYINTENVLIYGRSNNPGIKLRGAFDYETTHHLNLNNIIITDKTWGIQAWISNDTVSISDITINNLIITNISGTGIYYKNGNTTNNPYAIHDISINNFNILNSGSRHIQIDGNSSRDVYFINGNLRNSTSYGIYLLGVKNATFDNVLVENSTTVYNIFIDGSYNENILLNKVVSKYAKTDGIYSIDAAATVPGLNNMPNVKISNSRFENNFRDGLRIGNNTIIENSIIRNNVGNAILSTATKVNQSIKNNIISGTLAATTGAYMYDNYGVAPYNFGLRTTAPSSPFGAGDTFYNSSVLSQQQCWYKGTTLSWRNATNVTTGCST